jgi:hypothetical protein
MALLDRYRRVVILAPAAASGGPEAIHQLAYSLNALGVECRLAYYGDGASVQVTADRILCRPAGHGPSMETYRRYWPQVAEEIVCDAETLVVLPEVLTAEHGRFAKCGVAIWWLSVDFAIAHNRSLADPAGRAELFRHERLIHFHQSVYAREWLRQAGARTLLDLSDYTNETYLGLEPRGPSSEPTVCFNRQKGADVAEAFFAGRPQYSALGLKGFSQAELRAIYAQRLLYVDFGHLPGKDRMPREAAACGAVVFVNNRGAGRFYDDFPIPDFFKFTSADLESGELGRRLDAVIAAPELYWRQQAYFRSLIAWEKATFHDQIMRHWGMRRFL